MPSSTIENYAKHIFLLSQQPGCERVSMGDVARALGVVPGTATTMVKSLARHGYAEYEPRAGVMLSAEGRSLALQVLRRHRLIETFLVQTLGMDWGEIHEEAETLEHAISERMLERLDAFLGRPQYDPHGDPIPDAAGRLPSRQLRPLTDCKAGETVHVARVLDQEETFLGFLQTSGLVPGAKVRVNAFNVSAQCMELTVGAGSPVAAEATPSASSEAAKVAESDTRSISLGEQAAAKILVQ